MEIYRVARKGGNGEFYVEKADPEGRVKKGFTYVCTTSAYRNSMYGQIEECGWVETERLDPLLPTNKKNRETLERIEAVKKRAEDISKFWYELCRGVQDRSKVL